MWDERLLSSSSASVTNPWTNPLQSCKHGGVLSTSTLGFYHSVPGSTDFMGREETHTCHISSLLHLPKVYRGSSYLKHVMAWR